MAKAGSQLQKVTFMNRSMVRDVIMIHYDSFIKKFMHGTYEKS